LCRERFWPSRDMFAKLWRFTGGAVTPNDFLSPEERGEAVENIRALRDADMI